MDLTYPELFLAVPGGEDLCEELDSVDGNGHVRLAAN